MDRTCRKCQMTKPMADFRPHHKPGLNGHRWTCRQCERDANRNARDKRRGCPPRPARTARESAICTGCRLEKAKTEFRSDLRNRDGLRSRCKDCDRTYARDWQSRTKQNERWIAENPERYALKRREHLLRRYGMTVEDYETLLAKQDGRCAICRTDSPRTRGNAHEHHGQIFAVDHCHVTGAVRGLLCITCNTGIGGLRDDPAIVRAALAYLERNANA